MITLMQRCIAASLACLAVANLHAEESLKSGPQPGDVVGAFLVEKCAGNKSDGVPEGEKLCYRCKLGNRPVVAVFARSSDESLAALLREIDTLVSDHGPKHLASFVSLLGSDKAKLKSAAKSLVKKTQVKNIAVVVPKDHGKGPSNYKLHPKADFTILVYYEGKVRANFALPKQGMTKDAIKEITSVAAKLAERAS